MIMVDGINKTYFAGKREVTCYSCHHGADRPKARLPSPNSTVRLLRTTLTRFVEQAPRRAPPERDFRQVHPGASAARRNSPHSRASLQKELTGYDDPARALSNSTPRLPANFLKWCMARPEQAVGLTMAARYGSHNRNWIPRCHCSPLARAIWTAPTWNRNCISGADQATAQRLARGFPGQRGDEHSSNDVASEWTNASSRSSRELRRPGPK